jgi:hypothetical protein
MFVHHYKTSALAIYSPVAWLRGTLPFIDISFGHCLLTPHVWVFTYFSFAYMASQLFNLIALKND